MDFLDAYEMRARIAPTIVVFLPITITASLIIGSITKPLNGYISGGILFFALVYALSHFVRQLGKNIEDSLWQKWDGPPSTRFLRWRDIYIGFDVKNQLHALVESKCGIKLHSKEDEEAFPREADEKIEQAFFKVKGIVRKNDASGLWNKHNAEYGFLRNLLGSRMVWLLTSLVCLIASCGYFHFGQKGSIILSIVINASFCLISLLSGWIFLPKAVRDSADRYADSIWNTFLIL